MRLIDADKLIIYVEDCKLSESITWEEAELITDFLRNAPIVESRPKGEWIEGDRYSNHVCSICGEEAEDLQACGCCELLSDFCPHCGADMREGE